MQTPKHHDHNYASSSSGCVNKDKEITFIRDNIQQLHWPLNHRKKISRRNVVNEIIFINDENMKFQTGIPTVAAFNALYKIIERKIFRASYWNGPKPKSGLTFKDEITLTLTKLLLELLNRDLTHKFNISESEISKLFTTWIKLLTNIFGTLVFNPPKEVVREHLPPCFQNSKYSQVMHNIEVFLEKKTKVSGSRTSVNRITRHCGVYDFIEPCDIVMSDREIPH